eukprot:Phypoly_transcript_16231.p1 GENE.Phypoly_transcript_16231~~Phypoly_transcript_16231.p1  ORF type:complete len:264 (+),score=55.08 Phypoly_transcript_16231:85-792(+)
MAQVHSVRVKKWTQLRPEDFNGQASASLNARKRHSASPEPVNPSYDGPPSPSHELPRTLSVSPPPYPPSHPYAYQQYVHYQDRPSQLSHSLPPPSLDDVTDGWSHRDTSIYLPPPTLHPIPITRSNSCRTLRGHNEDEDHFYTPYPRPSTRRSLARSNPTPKYSRSISPTFCPPSYDFVSPPSSPPSLPRDDLMWKKMNPLINAVMEEDTVHCVPDSQDSVVPSMQKMKISNLIE